MLIRSAIAVVLLILVGYGAVEALPLIEGPALSATVVLDASSTPGIVTLSGTAARVTELALDGSAILTDDHGNFSRLIVLPRGASIMTLTATDRFGRSITKNETVYVP
ncbi:MAG TPA: hypothetical protein VHB93_01615 [Candidatus Paceibacterota bacterium]|nr:hypothetical protein [Candidatus Paceibacterota bacterium]